MSEESKIIIDKNNSFLDSTKNNEFQGIKQIIQKNSPSICEQYSHTGQILVTDIFEFSFTFTESDSTAVTTDTESENGIKYQKNIKNKKLTHSTQNYN